MFLLILFDKGVLMKLAKPGAGLPSIEKAVIKYFVTQRNFYD